MIDYRIDEEDKWFRWKGVKPPDRTSHGMTEEEIDQLLAGNLKDHVCEWEQSGSEIFCDVAPGYRHGKRIGVSVRLAGTENGKPVLVPVGPILRSEVDGS